MPIKISGTNVNSVMFNNTTMKLVTVGSNAVWNNFTQGIGVNGYVCNERPLSNTSGLPSSYSSNYQKSNFSSAVVKMYCDGVGAFESSYSATAKVRLTLSSSEWYEISLSCEDSWNSSPKVSAVLTINGAGTVLTPELKHAGPIVGEIGFEISNSISYPDDDFRVRYYVRMGHLDDALAVYQTGFCDDLYGHHDKHVFRNVSYYQGNYPYMQYCVSTNDASTLSKVKLTIGGNPFDAVPGGYSQGGCVLYNTDILMSNFTTKKAKDIEIGDSVISLYNGKYCKSVVENKYIKHFASLYDIEMSDGTHLTVTPNHPILCNDGYKNIDGSDGYSVISEGDNVVGIKSQKKVIRITKLNRKRTVYNFLTDKDSFVANGCVVSAESSYTRGKWYKLCGGQVKTAI